MNRSALALAAVVVLPHGSTPRMDSAPTIAANTNEVPAGRLAGGVLTLRLVVQAGRWYPEGEHGPAIPVQAFGEEGRAPQIPGPMIRVPEGTEIRVAVRNGIPGATLVVHGLTRRPADAGDSLVVPAGTVREARFAAGAPGTYFYWATTMGVALRDHRGPDSQLTGALIVDAAGSAAPPDRVFVIGTLIDTLDIEGATPRRAHRRVMTINGRSFPHTELLTHTVGDTVRWRWINASERAHPMHLHGFYYRVDSRGDLARDTVYAAPQRRSVVTERMVRGTTMALTWVPAQPGNWVFHCHVLFHIAPNLRLVPSPAEAHAGRSMKEEMAGLVLPIYVRPAPGGPPAATLAVPPRTLRLVAQARAGVFGSDPGYGFVLQDGGTEPAPDSVLIPGPPIVLTRGEPARITVVNRLAEPLAVHWHGIELQSYYDGVPGFSGAPGRLAPAIQPGDSFVAAFTPPRAGTFIYHTHIDDVRQLSLGLYGPLIVLEPGRRFDPVTDHVLVLSVAGTSDVLPFMLNGGTAPASLELAAGLPHRFRLIGIPPAGTLDIVLTTGDSAATWRAVAKDGADLPPAQATWRPARQQITVGETYDFELAPLERGDFRIEARIGDSVAVVMPVRVR